MKKEKQKEEVPSYRLLVINHAYNEGKLTFKEWLELSRQWALKTKEVANKPTQSIKQPKLEYLQESIKTEMPLDIVMSLLRPDELEKLQRYIASYRGKHWQP